MTTFDTLIIGAGAAGLFAGGKLAHAGQNVLVLDHAKKPAEKVRISGGGRCNFTNIHTSPANFLSDNPHFAKSALARYTPWDFCDLLAKHKITWHEKTLGQLFCDQKSSAIIDMLLAELQTPGGQLRLNVNVTSIDQQGDTFSIETTHGPFSAARLIIATGGLSIPKIGATGFAYEIARQFGHDIIAPRPALVPLTFSGTLKDDFAALSGVSTEATVSTSNSAFTEAMLFTHRGLSGPPVLQASSYWHEGAPIHVDLFPGHNAVETLKTMRGGTPRRTLSAALCDRLPRRLVDMLVERLCLPGETRLADLSNKVLQTVSDTLSDWQFVPTGTEGWRTAEVTAGGVSTQALSSQTLESQHKQGLYFIGECVDVTGWLGGYNFQWAWASAHAAAEAIIQDAARI